jgi:CDP-diacylglycerol pyrophosphatase
MGRAEMLRQTSTVVADSLTNAAPQKVLTPSVRLTIQRSQVHIHMSCIQVEHKLVLVFK